MTKKKTKLLGIFFFFLVFTILTKVFYLWGADCWRVDLFFYIEGAEKMIAGQSLYKDFGDIKPPLIFYMVKWLIQLFGRDQLWISLKTLTILLQTGAAFFLYLIIIRIAEQRQAIITTVFFILACAVERKFWPANVMLFALFPLVLSLYFYLRGKEGYRYFFFFLAGVTLALTSLLSTNLIFYTLLFPLLPLIENKNLKTAVKDSIVAFTGFILPYLAFMFVFQKNGALLDWFWWTFKWGGIYGSSKVWYVKLGLFFVGFAKTWEIFPLYFLTIWGLFNLIKKKKYGELNPKEQQNYAFLLTCFVLSLISRLILAKAVERYYLYLLPIWAMFIPFAWQKIKCKKIFSVFTILFFVCAFTFNTVQAWQTRPQEQFKARESLISYIIERSNENEQIFVWPEGFEIYYYSNRRAATSFFSPGQHLAYPYMWESNDYQDIDFPWHKFLQELQKNKPKIIVDLTGGFHYAKEETARIVLIEYMDKYIHFVEKNYRKEIVAGNHVWVLKE